MQSRRRQLTLAAAAALVVAVAAPGTAVPAAAAAPPVPGKEAAAPAVWPRPQSMTALGGRVPVPETVRLVAGPEADPYALDVIRRALRAGGARTVTAAPNTPGATPVTWTPGLTVYAGGPAAASALSALRARPEGDLPSGGYRLAVGDGVVALAGKGEDGLFHAAQTLRQLVTGRGVARVLVRDWPGGSVRGTAESFYGDPWTPAQRLALLDFMGRTKQNRYLYAPGDDPYRQDLWREPYPAAQRAQFRALAARARRNHVTLDWALSPGRSLCFSSRDDRAAVLRKADAMWELGVRAFQLGFQDVSYSEWHCDADPDRYGSGPRAAARAQAELANALAEHLAARGADLSLMPTEYYQDGATAYRGALARSLAPGVDIAWTGVGVVPGEITGAQVATARRALRHRLLTVDDYPVNDYAPDRLFLGPYQGREPAVALGTAGVVAAAMEQPAVSRIPLFTAADYAWNPNSYDSAASWRAAVDDLAGPDPATRAALRALAANDASCALDRTESAYLRPLLRRFWAAYEAYEAYGSQDGAAAQNRSALPDAARPLREAFAAMGGAPERLGGLAGGALGAEAGPWLERLAAYGRAGERALAMLLAQERGDGPAAWRYRLELSRTREREAAGGARASVGEGVLDPFLDRALRAADAWTGVRADTRRATTTLGSARATDPSAMTDGRAATVWTSDGPPGEDDSFGVDLGATRPVREVRVAMGAAQPGPERDGYLRDAVLEYSDGSDGWQRAGAFHGRRTVRAVLPEGATARYVRLRAAKGQETAVSVREFTVTAADGSAPVAASGGAGADAAIDGDVTTAYRAGRAARAGEALTARLGRARPLAAVTVLTAPDEESAGTSVEVHVPGQGWRRIGVLEAGGWSEPSAGGVPADAVRLAWAPGAVPPAVHEIVPWYADRPPAEVEPDRAVVDAEAGGAPVVVAAEVMSTRPAALRVRPAAGAPKGLRVSVPGPLELRRGGGRRLRLAVSASPDTSPGTYTVPVSVAADGRTTVRDVTVRVWPRTSGEDLARGAAAVSSGDETPDFPASAVTDGDPRTRWSSPVRDDAWVRVELARPARVGRVVLRWQDAYAARYRVLVSADGRTWRTAARVEGGRGGEESSRMDAPGTRFVKIQGVERGTRYGYSLYSVEVHPVTE